MKIRIRKTPGRGSAAAEAKMLSVLSWIECLEWDKIPWVGPLVEQMLSAR